MPIKDNFVTKQQSSRYASGERTGNMGGSFPQSPAGGNCLKVTRAGDAVLVQVHGLGNMHLAPTLQTFIESEIASGLMHFVIDLHHCLGLDSTFMGTFIGLSRLIKNKFGWFCLVNVSDDNRRLLKMLGIINMVSINDAPFPMPKGELTVLNPTNDPYVRQKQIHEAHKLLMDADPANKERFGPFIQALEDELADIPKILPPNPGKKGK